MRPALTAAHPRTAAATAHCRPSAAVPERVRPTPTRGMNGTGPPPTARRWQPTVYLVAWDVESALHESSVLTWLQAQPRPSLPAALHCTAFGSSRTVRRARRKAFAAKSVHACMRSPVCARKWERERVRALVCACVPSRAALRAFLPRAWRGAKGARVSATDARPCARTRNGRARPIDRPDCTAERSAAHEPCECAAHPRQRRRRAGAPLAAS